MMFTLLSKLGDIWTGALDKLKKWNRDSYQQHIIVNKAREKEMNSLAVPFDLQDEAIYNEYSHKSAIDPAQATIQSTALMNNAV